MLVDTPDPLADAPPVSFHQPHEAKFACALNGGIDLELPLGGLHLGDADVE